MRSFDWPPVMQHRTAIPRRCVQFLLALITVFVVAAFSPPGGVDTPGVDGAHTVATPIVGASAAGLGDRQCPCPDDKTQQTCSKGACPTALVLDASQPPIARDSAAFDVMPKRHKTSTPKPEPEPPRSSV